VAEAERGEALALLAELVEKDHPHHKPAVYGGMSLEELRQRVARKASPAGFLIWSNSEQSPIRKDKEKTPGFSAGESPGPGVETGAGPERNLVRRLLVERLSRQQAQRAHLVVDVHHLLAAATLLQT